VTAATGTIVGCATKALQVAKRLVAEQHHLAPASSVSAVGTTTRNMSFATKAGGTVAAGTPLHFYLCAVV
jgi:hypothetical protein